MNITVNSLCKELTLIVFLGLIFFGAGCTTKQNIERPNIIVFLADDLGFSDIGPYGAEYIETPNLDRLAAEGQRFSQFYNAARCSPTRASLLTGKYPHQSGMGWLAGPDTGFPAYQGYMNENKTIAEVLRSEGYQTMMTGKWHVGSPSSRVMPWTRGFNRYFGRPIGADYWDSSGLKLDGKPFEWPGDDFFMTEALGEYSAKFIGEHNRKNAEQPYFLYLAFNAPHWPLHARKSDIEKYRGKFMDGWDKLRKKRFENMVARGIVDENQSLPPRDPAIPAWETLSKQEQQAWDLKMAVYAAQVTSMDRAIGRVLDQLKEEGEARKTMVLFLSDNGASAEGIGLKRGQVRNGKGTAPGGPESFQAYLMPWAHASNTPFRLYKHWTHEGGIASPLIVRWPEVIREGGTVTDELGHVMDIMPTALDAAGATYAGESGKQDSLHMEGKSLMPIFRGHSLVGNRRIFWEHEGHRAVRDGKWKLVSAHKFDDWFFKKWGFPRDPKSGWELYNMQEDRFEQNNLADTNTQKRDELIKAYQQWAERVGVVDWSEVRPQIPLFNR